MMRLNIILAGLLASCCTFASIKPAAFCGPGLTALTYPDAQHAHIGTKDALNNEVKLAFGHGDFRWKPGHLRSAYSAICCQMFKPKI